MNSISKKRLIDLLVFTLGIIFVIILYQLFAWHQQNVAFNKENMKIFLPNVNVIFKSLFKSLGRIKTYEALFYTLLNLIISILIGGIFGISLGLLAGNKRRIKLFLRPLINLFKLTPVVVLVYILLVGLNNNRSIVPIAITMLIVMPIFYEGTVEGVESISSDLIDVYKIDSNFNFKVFKLVYIPSIIHFLKVSLFTAISFGLKVLISTEYLASKSNTFGSLMQASRASLRYSELYAYLIIILIVAFIFELIPIIFKVSDDK